MLTIILLLLSMLTFSIDSQQLECEYEKTLHFIQTSTRTHWNCSIVGDIRDCFAEESKKLGYCCFYYDLYTKLEVEVNKWSGCDADRDKALTTIQSNKDYANLNGNCSDFSLPGDCNTTFWTVFTTTTLTPINTTDGSLGETSQSVTTWDTNLDTTLGITLDTTLDTMSQTEALQSTTPAEEKSSKLWIIIIIIIIVIILIAILIIVVIFGSKSKENVETKGQTKVGKSEVIKGSEDEMSLGVEMRTTDIREGSQSSKMGSEPSSPPKTTNSQISTTGSVRSKANN